ncbi:hypothetical protein D3C78_1729210 [compost metagenome]
MFVGEHAALVGLNADAFQVEALGVRTTTDSHQHVVSLQGFSGATCGRLQAQADAIS